MAVEGELQDPPSPSAERRWPGAGRTLRRDGDARPRPGAGAHRHRRPGTVAVLDVRPSPRWSVAVPRHLRSNRARRRKADAETRRSRRSGPHGTVVLAGRSRGAVGPQRKPRLRSDDRSGNVRADPRRGRRGQPAEGRPRHRDELPPPAACGVLRHERGGPGSGARESRDSRRARADPSRRIDVGHGGRRVGPAAVAVRCSPGVRPYLEAGAGILGGQVDLPQTNSDVNFLLTGASARWCSRPSAWL
jgi:hypothetical protein